jgi:hypothetical protein
MTKKTKQTKTMTIEPIEGTVSSPLVIPANDVEEAVVIMDEEIDPDNHPNFIESNTSAITLEELSEKCIVPTFADNSLTIANQSFIESVMEAGKSVFGELTPVEIRVSHQVNGRVPSALHKKASELTDEEKTVYYQRMAFVCHVAALSRSVNGQLVHLCIGGVRAYNEDKLYGRQSPMKFKIFCGWQVRVCSNLMLTCDGFTGNLECMTTSDIKEKALELFGGFDPIKDDNLRTLEALGTTSISEEQFCKAVGRLRLYQALPTTTKTELGLPNITVGDQAVNAVVRGYVENPNFKKEDGSDTITLWQLLQLFNEAVKQTYIDRWLERNQNCTDFVFGLEKALNGESQDYVWFLS